MQTEPIDPETAQAISRQVTAFTNRYGGKFPALADDIRQEAWATALGSVHRYDPQHPGAKGYFYMVASRHVLKQITKWRSLLSLSNEAARQGIESLTQWRIDPQAPGLGLRAQEPDPEVSASMREIPARLAALRARWRAAVEAATAGLSAEERAVGVLAFGLCAPPLGPAQVARRTGIWRDEVERMIRTYRKAMRRPRIRALERKINLLEDVIS